VDFVSSTGFRGSFSFSCLLTMDLDNFRFIQVDFVADGGFLLIIHIGFRKFWWISWISIFRPTVQKNIFIMLHTIICKLSMCIPFQYSVTKGKLNSSH